jgi:hypothetical protein
MSVQNPRTWKHWKRKSVVAVVTLLSLLLSVPQSWAVPLACLPWANNADTYNPLGGLQLGKLFADEFWSIKATCYNPGLCAPGITVWIAGATEFLHLFSTYRDPALQYFDDRMVIVAIGYDNKVYANTWTGFAWQSWAAFPTPTNFLQFSPALATTIPRSPTVQNPGALVAVAKTTNGYVWAARSLRIVNGFSGYPEGWRMIGGPTQIASGNRACGNPSELRVGGQGSDGICYRRRSTNYGSTWGPDEVLDPCP